MTERSGFIPERFFTPQQAFCRLPRFYTFRHRTATLIFHIYTKISHRTNAVYHITKSPNIPYIFGNYPVHLLKVPLYLATLSAAYFREARMTADGKKKTQNLHTWYPWTIFAPEYYERRVL